MYTKIKQIIKIFIIYIIILLPTLAASIFVTQNLLDVVRREEEAKLHQQLRNAEVELCTIREKYKEKSIYILENKDIMKNLVQEDPFAVFDQIQNLKSLKLFEGEMSEILIYTGDKLYTGAGIVSPNTYFRGTLGCRQESVEAALSILNSSKEEIKVLYVNDNMSYLMFHFCRDTKLGEAGVTDSVNMILSMDVLGEKLQSSFEDDSCVLQISENEDDIWMLYDRQRGWKMSDEPNFLEPQDSYKKIESQDREVESLFGFNVSLWYNMDVSLETYYDIRNVNLIIMMGGLFLSVVITAKISQDKMNVLSQIGSSIVNPSGGAGKVKSRLFLELEYIQSAVNDLRRDWEFKMEKNRQALLNSTTRLLANGLIKEKAELERIILDLDTVSFTGKYCIYGIKLRDMKQMKQLEAIMSCEFHFWEPETKWMVFFAEIHDSIWGDERERVAYRLKRELESINIACDRIVVSLSFEHFSLIKYAYEEVTDMLHSRFSCRNGIICWEQWVKQVSAETATEIREENKRLFLMVQAVQGKDILTAQKLLNELKEFAQDQDEVKRYYIRYCFVHCLKGTTDLLNEEEKEAMILRLNRLYLEKKDKFWESANDLLQVLCKKNEREFDEILTLIDERYSDFNISLDLLADYMGVSTSQMSKLFKKKTGISYIEYLTRLRMEKASELLRNSTLSIKEIFCEVGYIDVVNASKKFKAYYNETPSTYRKRNMDEKSGI